MAVRLDAAGQDEAAGGVDDILAGPRGELADLDDLFAVDPDVGPGRARGRRHRATTQEHRHPSPVPYICAQMRGAAARDRAWTSASSRVVIARSRMTQEPLTNASLTIEPLIPKRMCPPVEPAVSGVIGS